MTLFPRAGLAQAGANPPPGVLYEVDLNNLPYTFRSFDPGSQDSSDEGQRLTKVLPALQGILLEEPHLSGPVRETIKKLVTSRLLHGHPIAVSQWERKQHMR